MKAERTWQTILLLTALSVPLIASTARAQYSGGSGTADDPYQIATATDLISLGQTPDDYDKHFILTADIDLDPNLPGGRIFDTAVIAPDTDANYAISDNNDYVVHGPSFNGIFDGNGHSISHLQIDGDDNLALFGSICPDAMICNLNLEAADIQGRSFVAGSLVAWNYGTIANCRSHANVASSEVVGGLAGINIGGTIWRCSSTATVLCADSFSGGLVGANGDNSLILNSHSDGVVVGGLCAGGLTGVNQGGVISMCSAAGEVTGDTCVGGLVGTSLCFENTTTSYGPSPGWISNCFSTVSVVGRESVGGLAGQNNARISKCYSSGSVVGETNVGGSTGLDFYPAASLWDIETSGQATSFGGAGLTTAQMHDPNTYKAVGWDFVDSDENGISEIWQMPTGGGYPVLAELAGYTPPQLQGQGTPEDPYLLHDATELGAMCYYEPWAHYRLPQSIDLSGIRWTAAVVPVLTGVFDGNDLSISGLTIQDILVPAVNSSGNGSLGLVGCLEEGGWVCDLSVVDVNISSRCSNVGAIVGWSRGDVSGCDATGSVTGDYYVGGLMGTSHLPGSISDCHVTVSVGGTDTVGGIAGLNTGTIVYSSNAGAVEGNGLSTGGLVATNAGTVFGCANRGSVTGDLIAGGLIGWSWGEISNSYNTGSVHAALDAGVVGSLESGYLLDCYNAGPVLPGREYSDGLVGVKAALARSWSAITGCFWDTIVSGQLTGYVGTGLETAEMQEAQTFLDAGWDFIGETANGTEDIWWIDEGNDYPRLWWEALGE